MSRFKITYHKSFHGWYNFSLPQVFLFTFWDMKTDDSALFKTWQNAKHIVIIPNSKSNQDVCFAALALLNYGKITGKDVSILHRGLATKTVWKRHVPENLQPLIYANIPKRFAILLSKTNLQLQNVSMEKEKENYRIVLEGEFSENTTAELNPKVQSIQQRFDLVVLIGPPTLNILLDNGWERQTLEQQPILLFSNTKSQSFPGFPNIQPYQSTEKSFSQKINNWFHVFETKSNPATLTLLLSGVIAFSSNFTKNIQAGIFSQTSELITAGADYYQAYNRVNKNLTLEKVTRIGGLLRSVEKLAETVYLAVYPKLDLKKLNLDPEDMLKHSEIYDCELAVIYIEGDATLPAKVYFRAAGKGTALKLILKKMAGKGNSYHGMALTKMTLQDFKQALLQILTELDQNETVAINPNAVPVKPLDQAGSYPKPLDLKNIKRA